MIENGKDTSVGPPSFFTALLSIVALAVFIIVVGSLVSAICGKPSDTFEDICKRAGGEYHLNVKETPHLIEVCIKDVKY